MIKGAAALGYLPPGVKVGDVGATLASENLRSLECRYGDKVEAYFPEAKAEELFAYDRTAPTPTAAELAKHCACYSYQTCEAEDWETSLVKAWVDGLEALAAQASKEKLGARGHDVAWASAPWGL
jgi:hypothetical protein